MNAYTAAMLAVLVLNVAVQLWLLSRQVAHVQSHRNRVPVWFQGTVRLLAHRRAALYTAAKARLAQLEILVNAALLLAWTLGGGLEWLDQTWRGVGVGELWSGVGFAVSAAALMSVLDVPLSAYRTFRLEKRFGFNRTTLRMFATDLVKEGALLIVLGVPLVWVVLWLMAHAGDVWWLWVWAVWMGFGLLMMWAYPLFIAPLFNRFTPLGDDTLRERVLRLVERCGFKSQGVFVMDGSRRSGHSNAYFTGLGTHKRIVFFDTLLKVLKPAEVEAVLAHELGHFKRHHVLKTWLVMAALSLTGLALLGWLVHQPGFYAGLGISTPSNHAALILFLLVIPLLGVVLQPVMAHVSRRHELEADDFASTESNPDALIQALVKLYGDNATTLTPDPLYSAFYDSHPPAPVRVAHLSTRLAAQPTEA